MSVGMQVVAEHVRAFELNNCILRTFPVGYWASARAMVRYLLFMMRTYVVPRLQAHAERCVVSQLLAHAERCVEMTCRYIPREAKMVLLVVVTAVCTVLAMRQLPRYITV